MAKYLYEWVENCYPQIKKASDEFEVQAHEATSKCVIVFKKGGFEINFDVEISIDALLGWGKEKTWGYHKLL